MTDTLVDLGWLAAAAPTSSNPDQQRTRTVALAALKFTADNIDVAKELTTEGISEDERQQYIRKISQATSSEIFEFSTCNRVLYVGFDIKAEALGSTISRLNNTAPIPFELYEDTDAWRQLVKVCSGLDSFMMGELQVMSQFRKSVNFHREHNLVDHFNSSFFEHVIAANRSVRKNLGFTHTTESMLSLATSALQTLLEERGPVKAIVLGFGDMGMKAVEALLDANQTNIAVVSRNPERSAERNPALAAACTMLSYEQWGNGDHEADLVISTIRNAKPTYNADHQLPLSSPATVMDFSWPPSVDVSGVADQHTLLGMDHWIKVARNVGQEWDYDAIIDKSESMIDDIQERYATALENKAQGHFRALVYGTMENLAKAWEESPHASPEDVPQLGAFSREIATWVCHQPSTFYLSELSAFVTNTKRTLSSAIIAHVDHEVKRSVLALSKQGSVSGEVA